MASCSDRLDEDEAKKEASVLVDEDEAKKEASVLVDEDEAKKEACVLDGFTEYETVIDMIEKLPHLPSSDEDRVVERACEKFQVIFNKYIEQPHLIDSKLDIFLNKIVHQLRNPEFDIDVKHRIFKFLFIITNVRGYKFIVERLPHEVEDLDPVLKMLEAQDPSDTNRWETRYGLILWLSIIVKLPFHISRFDSGDSFGEFTNNHGVMDRLLNVVQTYLSCSDACHRVAAYLNARLLTRTDVKEPHLETFIYWVIEMIDTELMIKSWNQFGLLSGLADILKLAERTDLLPHAHRIFECIQQYNCLKNYPLTDKLVMKIVTRVGLLFLKPRVNNWQYKKECMNLAINLKPGPQKVLPKYEDEEETSDSSSEDEDELDLDDDSSERVENIIQQLIKGLQNRFFQARLSASKGIARIVNRLNRQMGDQVICYVLDLLSPRMCDDAWHGGCMALAEIVRRGLLLPARIPEVVNLVVKALDYEKPHGATSVGDNVRDSAAYVCWGLARAYSIKLMEAHCSTLAPALLIVACYDREIHCRRSAAAAYQECVGRLGVFPHGIDIVTNADYFTLGSRSNAYLQVSVHIAQYREYTRPFISHLMERKLNNWDPNIRSLASKALHLLTAKDPQYMADIVLPQLIEQALSVEFNSRHGALLGLGEIIHALSLIPAVTISPHFIDELETMIITVYRKITVSSNDLIMTASCYFIEKCSPAKLPFRGTAVFTEWQWVLDTCIVLKNPDVRLAAARALKELCIAHYYDRQDEQVCYSLLSRLNLGLKVDERQMMGCALALGHLPPFMVKIHLPGVIAALIDSLQITKTSLKWAKGRSVAIKALASICISTGLDKNDGDSCYFAFVQIVKALLKAMDDYTISNQGDVGALSREAAMKGLQALLILATDKDAIELLSPEIVREVVVKVVQQGVERIDRVRNIAGNVFCNLLYKEDRQIPYFPARRQVEEIFTPKICESCSWANANNSMPLFVQLMKIPSYTKPLLLGLTSSIGGVLESLANCASDVTFDYLREQTTDEQKRIVEIVAEIFEENMQNDRIAVPILHFLELYFGSGCLLSLIQDPQNTLAMRILDNAKKTVTKTGNSKKLSASVGLFCELLRVGGDVARRSFVQLGIFLCHKFMWLRRLTAEKLTETLVVHYSECGFTPELEGQVIEMTSETEWELLTTDKARESRNALFQLLNLPLPCKISDRSADKTMSEK